MDYRTAVILPGLKSSLIGLRAHDFSVLGLSQRTEDYNGNRVSSCFRDSILLFSPNWPIFLPLSLQVLEIVCDATPASAGISTWQVPYKFIYSTEKISTKRI